MTDLTANTDAETLDEINAEIEEVEDEDEIPDLEGDEVIRVLHSGGAWHIQDHGRVERTRCGITTHVHLEDGTAFDGGFVARDDEILVRVA